MNKKLGYIFVALVLGLFVISACEQGVGIKPAKKLATGGSDLFVNREIEGDGNIQVCSCSGNQGRCKVFAETSPVYENGRWVGERVFTYCASIESSPCSGSCGSTREPV